MPRVSSFADTAAFVSQLLLKTFATSGNQLNVTGEGVVEELTKTAKQIPNLP